MDDRFRRAVKLEGGPSPEKERLSSSLQRNKQTITEILDRVDDLMIREIYIGPRRTGAFLAYLEPLVNCDLLQKNLLDALLRVDLEPKGGVTIQTLKSEIVPAGRVFEKYRWQDIGDEIVKGRVALFVEGQDSALVMYFFEDLSRPISQPTTEAVAKGPADAFNEDVRTNIALVRKRIRSTRLALEKFELGEITKTEIYLAYLKGYAKRELVEEVSQRLRRIKTDGVIGSQQVLEYIDDNPYSPFDTYIATERPDPSSPRWPRSAWEI